MLTFLVLSAPSMAATLTVSSSSTYTTIQDAIDAASSGDTISVSSGTYTECVDTDGKDLTITGASASTTTLEGSSSCTSGALIIAGGETVSFTNFTVENAYGVGISVDSSFATFEDLSVESSGKLSTSGAYAYGGGMYVTASYVDIADSVFTENTSDYGGALALDDGAVVTLNTVEFDANTAKYGGGAIMAEDSGTLLELESCTFIENGLTSLSSGRGGAIRLLNAVEFTDDGSTFEDNYTAEIGGALFTDTDCELTLTDTVFDSNYIDTTGANAAGGGAIYAEDTDKFELTGVTFTKNTAYTSGGAIMATSLDRPMVLDDCTFEENTVDSTRGGAVDANQGTDVEITDSLFSENFSEGGGGALSLYPGIYDMEVVITGTTFDANEIDNTSTSNGFGGAIFADNRLGAELTLEIDECTFTDNIASLSGGAVYTTTVDEVTITNSTFQGNIGDDNISTTLSAYFGGAVSIYDSGEVTLTGNTVCGNESGEAGGFHLETILDLVFENNIVADNDATGGDGGNLYFYDVVGEVTNNNVLGGSASGSGDGAFFDGGSEIDFVNTVVAYHSGDGVYANDTASASASSFTYNDWYFNTSSVAGSFSFSTTKLGNITSKPNFTKYSNDGDCSNDNFVLSSTSALIDAGDPSISDPDGSDSDIGAYGGPNSPVYDGDGDGYYNTEDCDDDDADINPGAEEVCDGVDNDCDDDVDEDPTDGTTYYADDDGDGYGDPDASEVLCSSSSGYVTNDDDCDDTDADINPDGTEVCDGDDNDCDGSTDGSDAADVSTFYSDFDGDGFGGGTLTESACTASSGYVSNTDDCDDGDSGIYPGADEYCDGDDNDCDGTVDEDSAVDASTWYYDSDGDGYGLTSYTDTACTVPSGYAAKGDDCDDGDSAINPAATEVCDGDDNDCDGTIDGASASDAVTYYADADGDGYGDAGTMTTECSAPSGYVEDDTDCDDTSSDAHPGGTEVCDGLDNDCDGDVDPDDATDAVTWYADTDGDGFGDAAVSETTCAELTGYVEDDTDCDDTSSDAYPGGDEYCDGLDNNCDGTVDEPEALDASTWYDDEDEDGYGNEDTAQLSCDQPNGTVDNGDDCDDEEPDANPDGEELPYDGVDNDCEGGDLTDVDGDGYDAEYVGGLDCDDGDATVYPGAEEDPTDGVDSDCDGEAEVVDGGDDTGGDDNPIDGDGSGGKEGLQPRRPGLCGDVGAGGPHRRCRRATPAPELSTTGDVPRGTSPLK